VYSSGMAIIELNITDEQVDRVNAQYPFYNLKNSITKGKSQVYGSLGEIVVIDHFWRLGVKAESTYDYDLTIADRTVDVKTKRTTVKPRGNYLCGIPASSTHQKCDYYFFVRILEDMTKAFLLGYYSRKKYFEDATFKKKGEVDVNGFVFKDDCYNLEIAKLKSFTVR